MMKDDDFKLLSGFGNGTITRNNLLKVMWNLSMFYETQIPCEDYTHLIWFGGNSKFRLENRWLFSP